MSQRKCGITNTSIWGQQGASDDQKTAGKTKEAGQSLQLQVFTLPSGLESIQSVVQHINIMVVIHLSLTMVAVFLVQKYDIKFDVKVVLLVSPIVFPLAFFINSDFQQREKVNTFFFSSISQSISSINQLKNISYSH